MKKFVRLSLILAFVFISFSKSWSQEYQFHKVYIYNFTKYIQWPSDRQSGDFVIGVYGKSSMLRELEAMAANRMVGSQKIVIKQIESTSDAKACHVLFIPSGKSGIFTQLKNELSNNPILFITEKSGLAKEGSDINFVLIDGKLKYEMNKSSLDRAGLKVMPDLVKLAILVNG